MNNKIITAVNVIIINKDKKVLIAKRKPDQPMPDKWEFPGGKLEEGETLDECAYREIQEELAIDIELDKYLGFEDVDYKGQIFSMHLYTAFKSDEEQVIILHEHVEAKWVNTNELSSYDMPATTLSLLQKQNFNF